MSLDSKCLTKRDSESHTHVMDFRDVIALWPRTAELAADLNEKYETVRKWKTRNSIPSDQWHAVVNAASIRGLNVTTDLLAQIAKTEVA